MFVIPPNTVQNVLRKGINDKIKTPIKQNKLSLYRVYIDCMTYKKTAFICLVHLRFIPNENYFSTVNEIKPLSVLSLTIVIQGNKIIVINTVIL